ncbi:hypothetical protein [Nocardia rhizosphaerae]|uniref:Uncharacterized protein n=1 Tax=Nocardia rhizosphaerae TaxID=1691571 RepID=A0ABV8LA88_9NOCA
MPSYLSSVAGDKRSCHVVTDSALTASEPGTPAPAMYWAQWATSLLDLRYAHWAAARTG